MAGRGWEEILKLIDSGVDPESIDEFTCNNCEDVATCNYKYDVYSIHGDCLASK